MAFRSRVDAGLPMGRTEQMVLEQVTGKRALKSADSASNCDTIRTASKPIERKRTKNGPKTATKATPRATGSPDQKRGAVRAAAPPWLLRGRRASGREGRCRRRRRRRRALCPARSYAPPRHLPQHPALGDGAALRPTPAAGTRSGRNAKRRRTRNGRTRRDCPRLPAPWTAQPHRQKSVGRGADTGRAWREQKTDTDREKSGHRPGEKRTQTGRKADIDRRAWGGQRAAAP